MSFLNAEGLAVYRGRQAVLQNVDMRIDTPGLFGLIGPNGGGKSTLLSVITGLLSPSAGQISVLGQPPREAASRLALVPQAAAFDRAFPVTLRGLVETALLGPSIFTRPGPDAKRRVDTALAQTGVEALANRTLSALSGGELQRGLIARALAVGPEFLLLDEPTASVDQDHADRLFELLCDLAHDIPVLVVSHSLGHIAAHCDRVFCVNTYLWEAERHARAADLADEIFNKKVQCGRREVAA